MLAVQKTDPSVIWAAFCLRCSQACSLAGCVALSSCSLSLQSVLRRRGGGGDQLVTTKHEILVKRKLDAIQAVIMEHV